MLPPVSDREIAISATACSQTAAALTFNAAAYRAFLLPRLTHGRCKLLYVQLHFIACPTTPAGWLLSLPRLQFPPLSVLPSLHNCSATNCPVGALDSRYVHAACTYTKRSLRATSEAKMGLMERVLTAKYSDSTEGRTGDERFVHSVLHKLVCLRISIIVAYYNSIKLSCKPQI